MLKLNDAPFFADRSSKKDASLDGIGHFPSGTGSYGVSSDAAESLIAESNAVVKEKGVPAAAGFFLFPQDFFQYIWIFCRKWCMLVQEMVYPVSGAQKEKCHESNGYGTDYGQHLLGAMAGNILCAV